MDFFILPEKCALTGHVCALLINTNSYSQFWKLQTQWYRCGIHLLVSIQRTWWRVSTCVLPSRRKSPFWWRRNIHPQYSVWHQSLVGCSTRVWTFFRPCSFKRPPRCDVPLLHRLCSRHETPFWWYRWHTILIRWETSESLW